MTPRAAMNRKIPMALAVAAIVFAACAKTDPYRRLEPELPLVQSQAELLAAYNNRWPDRFKCVQTVTIDFGPVTRTLVGYLIVQKPGKFRLQCMTEQGIRLLDIVGNSYGPKTLFAAEEFDDVTVDRISRNIAQVFLHVVRPSNKVQPGRGGGIREWWEATGNGIELVQGRGAPEPNLFFRARLTGNPPQVDWIKACWNEANQYRIDHYEWRNLGESLRPSVIVLRDRATLPRGRPYKLTIQLTELTAQQQPWPESTFMGNK